MSTSRQDDGKDIPVYTLDLKEGLTYMCDSRICEAKGGRQSFWRRKDIPGFQGENKWKENTLVPVGWKVHRVQSEFFYQCPICYREIQEPPYTQIHHPGQVESKFKEGGIPDNSNKKGGRRRKKRTRKRRKSRRKSRRKKRYKFKRKSRRKSRRR